MDNKKTFELKKLPDKESNKQTKKTIKSNGKVTTVIINEVGGNRTPENDFEDQRFTIKLPPLPSSMYCITTEIVQATSSG